MSTFVEIIKKTSMIEIAIFACIACLAITAGYASLSNSSSAPYGDITGSAHPVKVTPLATMQPMPNAIDTAQH